MKRIVGEMETHPRPMLWYILYLVHNQTITEYRAHRNKLTASIAHHAHTHARLADTRDGKGIPSGPKYKKKPNKIYTAESFMFMCVYKKAKTPDVGPKQPHRTGKAERWMEFEYVVFYVPRINVISCTMQ